MAELDNVSWEAVVVIATNPVDILRIAIACSSRAEHQILGSGTVVDTARLGYRLAATLGTEVALGLPCTIGREGVARPLLQQLDAEERGRVEKSAMVLATAYRSLS